MSGIPISALPKKYQAQIAAQLFKPGAVVPSDQPKDRLRQQQGDGLNKTERAFLEELKRTYPNGTIHSQDVTLRLGNGVRYTPDFMFLGPKISFFEVKGFMRDDAAVKIKVAARMYPLFRFILVTKKKGGWNIQEIRP